MFIALGILSIIAGIFVYRQSTALSAIESVGRAFGGATTNYGPVFLVVAALLLAAGICSLCSSSGEKRGLVKATCALYIVGAVIALLNFAAGDMKLWAVVCTCMSIVYAVWLKRNPPYYGYYSSKDDDEK